MDFLDEYDSLKTFPFGYRGMSFENKMVKSTEQTFLPLCTFYFFCDRMGCEY